jgi:hypothetical protein
VEASVAVEAKMEREETSTSDIVTYTGLSRQTRGVTPLPSW